MIIRSPAQLPLPPTAPIVSHCMWIPFNLKLVCLSELCLTSLPALLWSVLGPLSCTHPLTNTFLKRLCFGAATADRKPRGSSTRGLMFECYFYMTKD